MIISLSRCFSLSSREECTTIRQTLVTVCKLLNLGSSPALNLSFSGIHNLFFMHAFSTSLLIYISLIFRDEQKINDEYDPEEEPVKKFEWLPKTNDRLVRGRALFFGRNSKLLNKFKTAFINLEFKVEECPKTKLMETMESGSLKVTKSSGEF
jgi:hypothetical protein